ncbi:hypothetical protein C1646_726563 [Rhizophagus diaphanus]|nr:hypothetical protein C1646_726563 [Rhizophagus diaphanus] [Rhizophagus sp. MUCL 43196]
MANYLIILFHLKGIFTLIAWFYRELSPDHAKEPPFYLHHSAHFLFICTYFYMIFLYLILDY